MMLKCLFRLLLALFIAISRVQSFSVLQATKDKNDKVPAPTSSGLESSWANLQLSPLAVKSMPYRDFRVKIYQHGGDSTIRKSHPHHQRYFFTPIALLDHRSAVSSHNNVTGEAELRFVIHLWDDELEEKIAEYLSGVLGEVVKKHQLEVLPFEWVVTTTPRHKLTGQYALSGVRQQYQQEKFLRFSMICSSVEDCDTLAEQMKFNPQQFYHLKLKLGLESQKTRRKETTVRISSVQSGEFFNRLMGRFPNNETVLLTPQDAKRLIAESANSIFAETFDDTEVVDHQHSNIYWAVKQLLAMTKQRVVQSDNLHNWESLYWEKENQRPDKMASMINRIYNTTDSKGRQMLVDFFADGGHLTNETINDFDGMLESLLENPALFGDKNSANSSSLGQFSQFRQMNTVTFQQLLREAKKSIQWSGYRFRPKSILASKLDLGRIMKSYANQDFTDRKLFVSYASSLLVMSVKIDESIHMSIERQIQERFESVMSDIDSRYKMETTRLQTIMDGLLSGHVESNKKIDDLIGSQIAALQGDFKSINTTVIDSFQRIESKVQRDQELLQKMIDQIKTDMGVERQLQTSALQIIFQKIDAGEQNANVTERKLRKELEASYQRRSDELIKLKIGLAQQMMVVDRTYAVQMELLEGRLRNETNQIYQDQMIAVKNLLERYSWLLYPINQRQEDPITTTPSPWKTLLELLV
ncbi:hypothetical protein DAPPUDRAFT_318448 [Daphnia pulex]|uniref:Uncharacterized protein n=1 Tax=Daphnia pulex TaxID=6669 RepID=E9GIW0_DAPPU|nr:hypothetical protein DAPPUDRAFT_318448 [Daphnia pulex]|eukprot:EFX80583.1 hypothetical protein DAPPUDRAFT_318448 [Daphnia pulex]